MRPLHIRVPPGGGTGFAIVSLASVAVLYCGLMVLGCRAARALAPRSGVAADICGDRRRESRPGRRVLAGVVLGSATVIVTARLALSFFVNPLVACADSITAFLGLSAAGNALTAVVFVPFLVCVLAAVLGTAAGGPVVPAALRRRRG